MSSTLRMFIPITKVDEEKRIVYGVATAETPDRAGEICDYASSKPYFQAWSADAAKVTDGKSLGNVRAMHGNVAAGKLTAIDFNDAEKKIEVAAKVVDKDEWEKVIEGVYTGFSQGGRYIRRWTEESDGGLTRFTAEPSEISLVDLPCLPEATFSIVKANGATEQKVFKSVIAEPTEEAVQERAVAIAKAAQVATIAAADVLKARKELLAEALAKAQLPASEPTDDEIVYRAKKLEKDSGKKAATADDILAFMAKAREELVKEMAVHLSDGGTATDSDGDDVKARAMELATAQGVKEPHDQHFIAARAEILAAKDPNPPLGTAVEPVKEGEILPQGDADKAAAAEAAKVAAAAASSSDELDEPVQGFWDGERFHAKKKDAEKAIRARKTKKAVEQVTGPVDAALEAIKAKLGIEVEKTDYSTEARHKMSSTGAAEADGSYPIKNATDLHNAFMDFHRGKGGDEKDRAHIVARASALGLPNPFESAGKAKEVEDLAKALAKVDVPAASSTKGHVHAQMAHFHSRHFGAEQNPDMHKAAAGAHADAFLSHMHDQADCEQKSDMAWDATCKCYGMGKAAGDENARKALIIAAVAGGPAALGKALSPTIVAKLGKGFPTVARLACLIDMIGDLSYCVTVEEEVEGDGSMLPSMIRQNISTLSDTLKAMVEEETKELLAGRDVDFCSMGGPVDVYCAANPPADELAAAIKYLKSIPASLKLGEAVEAMSRPLDTAADAFIKAAEELHALEKKGARHGKTDQERVQKVHDLATDLGADCAAASSGKSASGDDMLKAENASLKEQNAALTAKYAENGPVLEEVLKRLAVVEAQPAPARAAIRAVGKDEDTGGGSATKMSVEDARKILAALTPEQRAIEMTKISLANPMRL